MAAHVQRVTDTGDDRLSVVGTVDGYDDEAGNPVIIMATGWVSAMEHHYDPDAYDAEGNLRPDAQPRAMADAERMAYWESLLTDSVPAQPAPDAGVLYQAPETPKGP